MVPFLWSLPTNANVSLCKKPQKGLEQLGFICVAFLEQAVCVTANAPVSEMMGLPGGNAAKRSKSFKKKEIG